MTQTAVLYAAILIITFLTGYLLCLYNSNDDLHNHGQKNPERIQPRDTTQD